MSVFWLTIAASLAGNLRYAEDQAPPIVNPLFGTTMGEARLNELIFGSLFGDDESLATVPRLAESAELSPDRLTMTLTLRSDITWQDGSPFTAKDVAFTIQAMKDPGTLSTEAGRVAFIKDVVVVDDQHLRINFVRPEARPEDRLQFKILPAWRFASTAVKRTDPFRQSPLGTGPYSLTRYNDDNSITLTASSHYSPLPGIAQITMKEVSDKNYQAKLLLYESLEVLVRVLPRDLPVLENNRKVELYPYQTNSWWYLGYNLSRAPFDDARVRRALGMLMDTNALMAPIGTGDLLSGPFVKSSPYYNHEVPVLQKNNAEAERLLTEVGWVRVGNQWTRNGKPVTLKVTASQALESAQEVVINLQSQLQSAGIGVTVEFLDDASWKSKVWNERSFDVVLSQWTFDRNEDVREQFYSTGSRNFVGYKNMTADQLLDQARDAVDPAVRKQALRDFHEQVAEDQPMVFLWTLDSYAAISTKVRNVLVHPFYFFTYVQSWQMR